MACQRSPRNVQGSIVGGSVLLQGVTHVFCVLFGLNVAPQAAAEESKPTGAYRPPGAYRAPGRRGPAPSKSKTPEIDSEIAFPSLSAAMATNKRFVVVNLSLSLNPLHVYLHIRPFCSTRKKYGVSRGLHREARFCNSSFSASDSIRSFGLRRSVIRIPASGWVWLPSIIIPSSSLLEPLTFCSLVLLSVT